MISLTIFTLIVLFAGIVLGAKRVEMSYAKRKRAMVCPKCNGAGRYETSVLTVNGKHSVKCEVCLMRGTIIVLDTKADSITNVARINEDKAA